MDHAGPTNWFSLEREGLESMGRVYGADRGYEGVVCVVKWFPIHQLTSFFSLNGCLAC